MRRRLILLRLFVPPGLLCLAVSILLWTAHLSELVASPMPFHPTPRFTGVAPGGLDLLRLDEVEVPMELTLKRGETLESVLLGFGLTRTEAHAAIAAASEHLDPKRLRAGDSYAALYLGGRALTGFSFALPEDGRVVLDIENGEWRSRLQPYRRSLQQVLVEGTLDGPLVTSLEAAGGHPELAYAMADVLQWDLDFTRDLRLDDRFRVLYEVASVDGARGRVQRILALQYENRSNLLEAYRFDDGYYDGDGRPLRKQFLRSPLQYSSRVTSRFSHRRFHPVLKVHRPHYGVDYGAPTGTPVRATANGSVTFAGWDRGGGKTVKVRHPNGYLTAYLHLSRYAPGIRPGARVEQGQVVGYVGATGLATAPHLDYRVQENQRWIDPLSLKSEPAPTIAEADLDRFFAHRDKYRSRLRDTTAGDEQQIASSERGAPALAAGR
jgi:murein DD-endopeptidase MepM/ murein hydrolase activator NlpD